MDGMADDLSHSPAWGFIHRSIGFDLRRPMQILHMRLSVNQGYRADWFVGCAGDACSGDGHWISTGATVWLVSGYFG
jgi:hypothetical protein